MLQISAIVWEGDHVTDAAGRNADHFDVRDGGRLEAQDEAEGRRGTFFLVEIRKVMVEVCQVGHFSWELEFGRQCGHVDMIRGEFLHLGKFVTARLKAVNEGSLGSVVQGEGNKFKEEVANVEWTGNFPCPFYNLAVRQRCC